MIKIVLEVWKLLFNETIVGILILELENNSYSSLWFFPDFTIKICLEKILLGLIPNSKV
jgi:hypothetical protein